MKIKIFEIKKNRPENFDELFALTFFILNIFDDFFMDQCSFSVRSEWRRLERSILQPQRIRRTLYGFPHFGYEKLPGGRASTNQLQGPTHVNPYSNNLDIRDLVQNRR